MTIESANYETAIEMAAKNLEFAMEELSKSDWVSVEDELPPYYEAVLVCHKDFPYNVRIANRVERERNCLTDYNGFTLNEFDLSVSHWKPIDKLEE